MDVPKKRQWIDGEKEIKASHIAYLLPKYNMVPLYWLTLRLCVQNILHEDTIPWTAFIHLFIVLSKTILDKNINS